MTTPIGGQWLFPPAEDRARIEEDLTHLLEASRRDRASNPVTPTGDLTEWRETLAAFDFDTPGDLSGLLRWTVASMDRGMVHMTHPHHFGLFNPEPTFPAQCADRIVAAFNPQLAVWSHAPVPVEIEAHVISEVAQRAGLPAGSGGHFTSGGSEANATALLCALTHAHDGFGTHGVSVFGGDPVFYASAESHLAWLKIAHQSGLGRDAVRLVATDGSGRMDSNALQAAIAADKAVQRVPVMIVATAGTTNAGMIDPLEDCARIAAEEGLWLHVDAAWAGAMVSSPRLAPALDGLASADSVTIDAHKWFAATMGCGMVLVAQPEVLSRTFGVAASYMPPSRETADPYVRSMQWSRRFLGLRLFLSLATVGWDGYAAHVERSVALIEQLADRLTSSGWCVRNDPRAGVLCLTPPDGAGAVRDVVDRVVASGAAWVSAARFEGSDVVRVCVTNGNTAMDDVNELAALLETATEARSKQNGREAN
ncbi:MAG: aminotransferase class V-fold PLP-dependent enzyme [Nitriliruptorales bacterium]|nr:aminotransferase class V-fold PLP-dependent enzyme [Nitriliruptorales bacterium]